MYFLELVNKSGCVRKKPSNLLVAFELRKRTKEFFF